MVKETLDYKIVRPLACNYQKHTKSSLVVYLQKYLHATVEINPLYSLWNELVICSAFRSIVYIHFTSVEKHVN